MGDAAADMLDSSLDAVETRIRKLAGPRPAERFGGAIRRSIDEVLDGPRTGRWGFAQLEKTEKTYVGTKIEIVVRTALNLDRGKILDLEIDRHPVDIKWAMNSGWQIPREAVGQMCLCLGGLEDMKRFQVGLVRCNEGNLNKGENRDGKRTLSAVGRSEMRLIVPSSPLPGNFVAEMDDLLRLQITEEPTIQARITRLFTLLPRVPIPRGAVATVARTPGDPMRRVRSDTNAGDPLDGMVILSAKYGNPVVEALGYTRLARDEFMSVPRSEIAAIPEAKRALLPDHARDRLGLN
jgi:hypothetical protein